MGRDVICVQPILEIKHVKKSYVYEYRLQNVLRDVSLEVNVGQICCLLGYSGCGKTTLLRMIAALERADGGEILVDGKLYAKPSREVLLLFQDFNQLLPWKTVIGNIVYALKITGVAADNMAAFWEAEGVLKEVGLYEFRNKYPKQLSGGMKQRAAVARALALKPKILLMDEPFASLDMVTRHNLQKLVREKCLQYGITVVFVTHGVEEAVLTGDKIAIMKARSGKIAMELENPYVCSRNSVDKMKIMSVIMEQLSTQAEEEEEIGN